MVFSSFLSACAANINIKTTVCTIFSLPATKIQYPATAAGNRVTERPQADRQNPDGRLRRRRADPVVHRSTGPENAAGRKATGRGSQNRPRTTERAKPAQNLTRRTRTRAEWNKKPGRSGTRDPGGVERETRAGTKKRTAIFRLQSVVSGAEVLLRVFLIVALCVTAHKLIDATGGVHQLHLARVERVRRVGNFHLIHGIGFAVHFDGLFCRNGGPTQRTDTKTRGRWTCP